MLLEKLVIRENGFSKLWLREIEHSGSWVSENWSVISGHFPEAVLLKDIFLKVNWSTFPEAGIRNGHFPEYYKFFQTEKFPNEITRIAYWIEYDLNGKFPLP